jgi:superoxide dismutase, Cu-Zn family
MIIKSLALLALFLSSTTFGARIRQAPDVSEDPPVPKGFEIEKRDVQEELKKVKEGKELETTSMIDEVQGDIRGRGAYATVIYPLKAVCLVEQPTSGSNDAREKPRGTLTFT